MIISMAILDMQGKQKARNPCLEGIAENYLSNTDFKYDAYLFPTSTFQNLIYCKFASSLGDGIWWQTRCKNMKLEQLIQKSGGTYISCFHLPDFRSWYIADELDITNSTGAPNVIVASSPEMKQNPCNSHLCLIPQACDLLLRWCQRLNIEFIAS